MKEPTAIERKPALRPSLDYELLRQLGIRFAQQFSGSIWTDYNEHDPGVTIIEYLAYALTDLAYRNDFSVHELLTAQGGSEEEDRVHSFFLPDDIYSCRSLTPTDYRKLIIQHFTDVVNAWVEPDINNLRGIPGLINIRLQLAEQTVKNVETIRKDVRRLFLQQRNLGEDLGQIIILQAHQLIIKTSIQLKADATAEYVLAHILHQLEEFLQTRIRAFNLQELEEQGWSYEQIFTGPVAYAPQPTDDEDNARPSAKGFIRSDDLLPWVASYNVSDIREILLEIDGVQNVDRLLVWKNGEAVRGDSITVEQDTYLQLDPLLTQTDQGAYPIQFFRGQQLVPIDLVQAEQVKNALAARSQENRQKLVELPQLPPPSPLRRQEISAYHSIQRLLPVVYGVGPAGLPEHASLERQGQAQQLKAYLLFFEQLLANHLSQLAQLPQLFSIPQLQKNTFSEATYFSQFPFSIPGVESIMQWPYTSPSAPKKEWNPASWKSFLESTIDKITKRFKNPAVWKKRLIGFLRERYGHVLAEDALERAFSDTHHPTLFKKHLLNLTKHWEQLLWEPFILEQVLQATQELDHRWERKNRLLDHLLARFGMIIPTDHFKRILPDATHENELPLLQLKVKADFLTAYAHISQHRGAGMDFARPFIDDHEKGIQRYNVSGLEKRLHTLLNWDLTNRPLSQLAQNPEAEKSAKSVAFPPQSTETANLPLRPLLRHGIQAVNYRIRKTKKEHEKRYYFQLSLEYQKFRHQQTLVLYDRITTKKKALQKREELMQRLKLINRRSVGFYVVEPILLRPTRQRHWQFSFSLQIEGHSLEFNSRPLHDRDELQNLASDLLIFATRTDHYQAKAQYQIVIQKPIFVSIDNWTDDPAIRQNLLSTISKCVRDKTKHNDIANNLRIELPYQERITFNSPDSPSAEQLMEHLKFLSEQEEHDTFFNFTDEGQLVIGYTLGWIMDWQGSIEEAKALRKSLIDSCCNAPYDQPPWEEGTMSPTNQQIILLEDGKKVRLQLAAVGPVSNLVNDANFLLELLQKEQTYFIQEGFQLSISRRAGGTKDSTSGDLFTNALPLSGDEKSEDWIDKVIQKFKKYRDQKPGELLSRLQWKLEDFGRHDEIKQRIYAHRISLICPAWPESCQQQNFRDYFRNLVAEEIPAHMGADFYWLSIPRMRQFEKLYAEWRQHQLELATASPPEDDPYKISQDVDEAALKLIDFLVINKQAKHG